MTCRMHGLQGQLAVAPAVHGAAGGRPRGVRLRLLRVPAAHQAADEMSERTHAPPPLPESPYCITCFTLRNRLCFSRELIKGELRYIGSMDWRL